MKESGATRDWEDLEASELNTRKSPLKGKESEVRRWWENSKVTICKKKRNQDP
jgi:hypothetical protein